VALVRCKYDLFKTAVLNRFLCYGWVVTYHECGVHLEHVSVQVIVLNLFYDLHHQHCNMIFQALLLHLSWVHSELHLV